MHAYSTNLGINAYSIIVKNAQNYICIVNK